MIEALDAEVEEASATLGASGAVTLRRVVLPTLTPALVTGFALALARSVGEFGSVIFIAGDLPFKAEIAPLLAVFAGALAEGPPAALLAQAQPDARQAIGLTLLVAAIPLPLNALVGVAAASAVAGFDFRGKALLVTLIDLPFSVSPVVAGLAPVLLCGSDSSLGGWLVAHDLRIVLTLPGIVLATLFVTFPFVARELIPVMVEQRRAEEEAALSLGASG